MFYTEELGPLAYTLGENFSLSNHKDQSYTLDDLMGTNGVLLSFIGDIWHPTSVRRILWLQRHVGKFALMGTPVAVLVRDLTETLYGFEMSSPLPVPFPLLADEKGDVHRQYRMDRHPGLLLIDNQQMIREKWLMPPDRVWPSMKDLVNAIQQLA